jgi:hypothetical protein
MVRRIVLLLAVALAALYAGDYLSLRYRIPNHREQFGVVKVRRYYAIPQKNNRLEYTFDAPENQTCVQSLFPHLGCTPCWYLRRRAQKRIDL